MHLFDYMRKNLDAVENLANELAGMRIETITRAREIAGIRQLEEATNQVILIISIAVGAGFIAFTLSSAKGAVARKKNVGHVKIAWLPFAGTLTLYPVVQAMLIALCGLVFILLFFYAVVSYSIGNAFSQQGTLACRLAPADIILGGRFGYCSFHFSQQSGSAWCCGKYGNHLLQSGIMDDYGNFSDCFQE